MDTSVPDVHVCVRDRGETDALLLAPVALPWNFLLRVSYSAKFCVVAGPAGVSGRRAEARSDREVLGFWGHVGEVRRCLGEAEGALLSLHEGGGLPPGRQRRRKTGVGRRVVSSVLFTCACAEAVENLAAYKEADAEEVLQSRSDEVSIPIEEETESGSQQREALFVVSKLSTPPQPP